jgi:transmembrane sensor
LALVLALQPSAHELPIQEYRSAVGKSVEVTLDGGAKILLAPVSDLKVQGKHVSLQGTGYFDVPHQPGRTLTISAGDLTIKDIGTRFSVANEIEGAEVEVAEGSVSVTSDRLAQRIVVPAGRGLLVNNRGGTVRLISVAPLQVAGWRTGNLQFDQVPLALVARDVSRYSGAKVTVDPAIAEQPFSGVIAVNHGEAPARTLAQILSLEVKKVGGVIRLEPHRR